MGSPKDSIQTKLKLIQVAGMMFAEYGYNQVTVRDIIEAAHANLGALNYHFGTKECLYGEVLKEACLRDRLDSIEFEGDGPVNCCHQSLKNACAYRRLLLKKTGISC